MKKTSFSIPESIQRMVGKKFNHFTIVRVNKALSVKKRKPFVDAKCDCGKMIHCNAYNFVYDLRFSCGHVRRENPKKRYWKVGSTGYPKSVERTMSK